MNLKHKIKKLKNDSEFKEILSNMNWLFFDKAVQMGIAFFVSIWVIRYLGPEQYGVLSYAVAIVAFFSVFSKLGLDSIVVKELVNKTYEINKILGTVFYLKLFGSIITIILATLVTFLFKKDILITVATSVVSFSLIFQSTDVIDYWFQSKVISKYIAYSRSIAYIISAGIKIWLILIGASLIWFVAMISIETFFVAIGFIIAYYKNQNNIGKWIFDKNIAKNLLKDSWPLILSSFAVVIYMRIDQIMIGNILGYKELGQYTVAVNLSEIWYFIPVIITTSVFPAIIKAKRHNEILYYNRLQKLYDAMVWLAVSIAVFMTFLSNWIIGVLYGQEYWQSGNILAIYIWAGIFVFLGIASEKAFVVEKIQSLIFQRSVLGVIINVVLNIFLIPRCGMQGAAVATLFSQFFVSYLFDLFNIKSRISFLMKTKAIFLVDLFDRGL